jgi:transcription antitermination factor NusG
MTWKIIKTEPNSELRAYGWLKHRGFWPYLPFELQDKGQGKRTPRRMFAKPLFPGYLFVPSWIADKGHSIEHCPGVQDYMTIADNRCSISEEAMNIIQEFERERLIPDHQKKQWPYSGERASLTESKFNVGDKIRVNEEGGAWAGFLGKVQGLDKKDQAVIDLVLPSRAVRVTMPTGWLQAEELAAR